MLKKSVILILGMALVAILIAGCGTSSTTTTSAAPGTSSTSGAAPGTYSVMTSSNSSLGTFLVDGAGRTLYRFSTDSPGSSSCTAGCLVKWPVFYASPVNVPSDLSASDFTEFTDSDGSKQTEYKGQPLYYFFNDTAPGDTNGQGVNAFGGYWYVVSPS